MDFGLIVSFIFLLGPPASPPRLEKTYKKHTYNKNIQKKQQHIDVPERRAQERIQIREVSITIRGWLNGRDHVDGLN